MTSLRTKDLQGSCTRVGAVRTALHCRHLQEIAAAQSDNFHRTVPDILYNLAERG